MGCFSSEIHKILALSCLNCGLDCNISYVNRPTHTEIVHISLFWFSFFKRFSLKNSLIFILLLEINGSNQYIKNSIIVYTSIFF